MLVAGGAAVAAAFYGIIPGYAPMYLSVLALALLVAILAYRGAVDPDLRGPSSAILAGCVAYWALGGLILPEWINGIVLLFVPILLTVSVVQLQNRRRHQPISRS